MTLTQSAPDHSPDQWRSHVAEVLTRARNRSRMLERLGGPRARHLALFVGSGHAPNIEAGRAVMEMAPLMPEITFLLAGRHSRFLDHRRVPANVRLLGPVGDDQLADLLGAADVALNPMGTGGEVTEELQV